MRIVDEFKTVCEHLRDWRAPNLGWLRELSFLREMKFEGRDCEDEEDADVALHRQNGTLRLESIRHNVSVEHTPRSGFSEFQCNPDRTGTFRDTMGFLHHPGIFSLGPTTVMTTAKGDSCVLVKSVVCRDESIDRHLILINGVNNPSEWCLYDILTDKKSKTKKDHWAGFYFEKTGEESLELGPMDGSCSGFAESHLVGILETDYRMSRSEGCSLFKPDADETVLHSEAQEGRMIELHEVCQKAALVNSLIYREAEGLDGVIGEFVKERGKHIVTKDDSLCFRWQFSPAVTQA